MSKFNGKINVHVSGRMSLDDFNLSGWTDEERANIFKYDEEAWDVLTELATEQMQYWIADGTLIVELDPIDF